MTPGMDRMGRTRRTDAGVLRAKRLILSTRRSIVHGEQTRRRSKRWAIFAKRIIGLNGGRNGSGVCMIKITMEIADMRTEVLTDLRKWVMKVSGKIISKPLPVHACWGMPEAKLNAPGTVWQCDECSKLWVTVMGAQYNEPYWAWRPLTKENANGMDNF